MGRTKLNDNDIQDIIQLYQTEIKSTTKLAEKFKVGKKRIVSILKENNIEINKKGGQVKHIGNHQQEDYSELCLKCNKTGKTFNDVRNEMTI